MKLEVFKATPQDSRIPNVFGIRTRHAERLLTFCQGYYRSRQLIVIVRGANPASLRFQGKEGRFPKPYGVNEKTSKHGRVRANIGDEATKSYYSDYDLQGVYEQRHTGDYNRLYVGNYIPKENIGSAASVSPVANPFLNAINKFVCRGFGDPDMFQHGTQDDYRQAGRPAKDLKNDGFLAFEHSGNVYLLPNLNVLREYYRERPGLSWIY